MSIAAREEDSFLSHDRSIGPFTRIVEPAPRARRARASPRRDLAPRVRRRPREMVTTTVRGMRRDASSGAARDATNASVGGR